MDISALFSSFPDTGIAGLGFIVFVFITIKFLSHISASEKENRAERKQTQDNFKLQLEQMEERHREERAREAERLVTFIERNVHIGRGD